jgi:hypothetical protein
MSLRPDGPTLTQYFAHRAWESVGGPKVNKIRATAFFGSDLIVDSTFPEPGVIMLAYVVLPNVTLAGWVDEPTVRHPGRVTAANLRSVWELLPHRWMGLLSQPSRQASSTWMEWLSQPSACIMAVENPTRTEASHDRPDRTPPVGHPLAGRHAHAHPGAAAV